MKRPVLALALTLVSALLVSAASAGRLRLPPIFDSGMVLQQQAEVEIWGWAGPGAGVVVRTGWDGRSAASTAGSDGRWKVTVSTPAAGFEPQTMTIDADGERIELRDILIGDVWFISGQSNMQMDFGGNPDQPVENAQKILLGSKHRGIRLFRVEPGYATAESDTTSLDGAWYAAMPDNVRKFSVIGYVFGQRIHHLTEIPIGLVQSAHGGSAVEAWLDRATLERFGGFELDLSQEEIDRTWYPLRPTVIYNKMLAPLLPLTVKGVVWYQGESNVARPDQYRRLFPEMIAAWRRYFRNERLPFYYVQIAPYNYENANSARLREAQLEVMNTVDNVGMAVTLDVGEQAIIHPARKEVIGERLAYWALNRQYGMEGFRCRGPEFRSMEVKDGRAVLKFDYAQNGLSFFGKEPLGFEIAGDDRVFHPARVRITPAFWGNEGLEVWNDSVRRPVAVRYGYTNYIDGSLYNTDGLPASSFRTDKWDVE